MTGHMGACSKQRRALCCRRKDLRKSALVGAHRLALLAGVVKARLPICHPHQPAPERVRQRLMLRHLSKSYPVRSCQACRHVEGF